MEQKQQHSPGPWTMRPTASGNLFVYSDERTPAVAGVSRVSRGIDDAEAEANARLIAAAPQLLAQLRAIVADVQAMRCGLPDGAEDWTADDEPGLFGWFESNYVHRNDGSVVISWQNLGVLLADAQSLLGAIDTEGGR